MKEINTGDKFLEESFNFIKILHKMKLENRNLLISDIYHSNSGTEKLINEFYDKMTQSVPKI